MSDEHDEHDEHDAPESSSPSTSPRSSFSFFNLCRELRDAIYDECVQTRFTAATGWSPETCATVLICPHLLLINRQFATEYKSGTKDRTALTMSNNGNQLSKGFVAPQHLRKTTTTLTINIWCRFPIMLPIHRDWIDGVLPQMDRLRGVEVCIAIKSSENWPAEFYLDGVKRQDWVGMERLVGLRVYEEWREDGPVSALWTQLGDSKLLMHLDKTKDLGEIERMGDLRIGY